MRVLLKIAMVTVFGVCAGVLSVSTAFHLNPIAMYKLVDREETSILSQRHSRQSTASFSSKPLKVKYYWYRT